MNWQSVNENLSVSPLHGHSLPGYLMQRCQQCGEHWAFTHVCPQQPALKPQLPIAGTLESLRQQIDELQRRAAAVEKAYAAACKFIDVHVGDPDITQAMREAWAEFTDARNALETR